jgi:hypothetical protein
MVSGAKFHKAIVGHPPQAHWTIHARIDGCPSDWVGVRERRSAAEASPEAKHRRLARTNCTLAIHNSLHHAHRGQCERPSCVSSHASAQPDLSVSLLCRVSPFSHLSPAVFLRNGGPARYRLAGDLTALGAGGPTSPAIPLPWVVQQVLYRPWEGLAGCLNLPVDSHLPSEL